MLNIIVDNKRICLGSIFTSNHNVLKPFILAAQRTSLYRDLIQIYIRNMVDMRKKGQVSKSATSNMLSSTTYCLWADGAHKLVRVIHMRVANLLE